MFRKKLMAVILAAVMCLAMTGCMAAEYKFDFNKDASGTLTCGAYFSDEFIEAMDSTVDEVFADAQGEVVQKNFNGKSYHGVVESANFKNVEELKSIMASDSSDDTTGAAEDSMAWTFAQTTESGQSLLTITMNLSSNEEITGGSGIDVNETEGDIPIDTTGMAEDLQSVMYVSMDFSFPGGIKSVTGINSGYKIDGNKLHIDATSSDVEQVIKIVGILDGASTAPVSDNAPFKTVTSMPAGKFTDVPADAWYANALKSAYEYGFVSGTSATTFSPNNKLSIAQVAQICANMRSNYDNDVDTLTALRSAGSNWYDGAVQYCIQKGIMNSATEFGTNMNKACTRAEMCQFFAKVLPDSAYTSKTTDKFTDVTASTPYAAAIEKLHAAGIVNGYGNGVFGPSDSVTRAQTMVFISNIATMANNNVK